MKYYLKNAKTLLAWLICFSYAGLFFPVRISNIVLTALIIFCALIIRPGEILDVVKRSVFARIMLASYFLLIVGLFYTTELKTGLFILEKKIFFLLIPLFVLPAIAKFYSKENDVLVRSIGYLTIFSSLCLLLIGAYRYFILNDNGAFTFAPGNQFDGFTSIHYVYYAMYFGCGSLLLIDSLLYDLVKKKYGIFVIALLFAYCLGIIILVASKTGIIAYALASIVFLHQKLENKRVFTFLLILFLLCGSTFLYLNDTTRTRFKGLGQDLSVLKHDELVEEFEATGLNMRLLFWKIQLSNAWKDGLIFTGTGTGDIQHYIDDLYNLPKYQLYGYLDWDSHNQWVYTLLQVGIMGVLLLALLYYFYFKKGFEKPDVKLICFLIITLAFSFTESVLELNKGIVFFCLFLAILTPRYLSARDPVRPN